MRDAALELIAERAEVSPALVVHHFGSKDGLRAACDEHLLTFVQAEKSAALTSGSLPGMSAYLARNPQVRPMYAYLVRVLAEELDVAAVVASATGAPAAAGVGAPVESDLVPLAKRRRMAGYVPFAREGEWFTELAAVGGPTAPETAAPPVAAARCPASR